MQEYQSSYFHYGTKNCAKLNKDITYVKRIVGKNGKPNLAEAKKIMDENFMKDQLGFAERRVEFSNVDKPSKQQRKYPSSLTLAVFTPENLETSLKVSKIIIS